jgi:MFS family permease
MLKKLIKQLLAPRHYWRTVTFDELSELYTSMLLRGLAISLVGIFIPVYLYKLGYKIPDILLFYTGFFFAKLVFDFIAAYVVAKQGPKHTIILSYSLQVVSLGMLLTLPTMHWSLEAISGIWGASSSLFFIAYHVDFSKIKHSEHGGKEIGYMFIIEKIGAIIGPLIGGLVANYFGAHYIIAAAATMFTLSIIPLLLSPEPVRTNQVLHFSKLPTLVYKRDALAYSALGIENSVSIVLWPLCIVALVFTNDTYAKIGILSAAGVFISLFTTRAIGALIDNKKGRQLLRFGVVVNAANHLVRIYAKQFWAVFTINMVNEAATPAYRMPFIKGWYDASDDLEGLRIVYLATMEAVGDIAKATLWALLFVLSGILSTRSLIGLGFIIGAVASLLIATESFPALGKKGAHVRP